MNTPRAEEQLRLAVDAIGLSRAELDRAIQYLAPVRGCDGAYDDLRATYLHLGNIDVALHDLAFAGGLSLDSEPKVKP